MDVTKIREKAEACLDSQVELLTEFSKVDCESKDIEGNRRVVDMAEEVLSQIEGIQIKETFFEDTGAHIVARIVPENPSGKIVINCHLDTVFPKGFTEKNPPFIDDENWLHGLGTGDCKGGFAVSAYAVKIASELGLLPNKEIVMIYSCDEEIGSITSREVFKEEAEGAECAFVFEGAVKTDEGYGIVSERRGVILGALDIKGVEAHAGAAYMQGHSAIKELAHKILKYYSFNDYEREIYYNVAPISGGAHRRSRSGHLPGLRSIWNSALRDFPHRNPLRRLRQISVHWQSITRTPYAQQQWSTEHFSLPLNGAKREAKPANLPLRPEKRLE